MKEIWKDIKGYEGLYKISNYGRVKSLNYNHTGKERILKQNITGKGYKNNKGYCSVQLFKNGIMKEHRIHRLVMETFVGKSNLTVNHKNNITIDNRLENLEYMSNHDNIKYSQSKCVKQYTLDGVFIKEWNCINDAIRETKASHICDCCKGKRNSSKGFIWRYSDTK